MQEEQMRRASGDKISIPEIAGRLLVDRMAVYQLLESRTIPANRLGWRRIVTRHAYEQVEKTCGMSGAVHISRPALKHGVCDHCSVAMLMARFWRGQDPMRPSINAAFTRAFRRH